MRIRSELRCVIWAVILPSVVVFSPRAGAQDAGSVALAERYAQMARDVLAAKSVGKPQVDISTALLEAAVRENPNAPHLLKLLIEAYVQTGNSEAAKKTVEAYRKLQPGDRLAQIQLIDIYLSQQESADQRQKYLLDLFKVDALPAEVRAHCGVKGAKVLLDRGDDTQAHDVLSQALALNPLDGEGLRLRYELALKGTSLERTHALLGLLRANPGQPAVMARVAAEFAAAGVPETSIQWYDRSMALAQRMGLGLDPNDFLQSAIEKLINEKGKDADASVAPLQENDPTNLSALTVRLLAARQTGNKDAQARWQTQAFDVLANRINAIDTAVNGKRSATTKPSTNPGERLPDLVADAKAIVQANNNELHDAFAQSLVDFAWLEIYYFEKPAQAATALEALKILLPPESELGPRLEGWSFLMLKRNDEAKVKLSAVADKDPLSKAGLLLIAPADRKAQTIAAATKLIQENPNELEGAMVLDALRPLGAKLSPGADAPALADELKKFPIDCLQILDTPKQFYSLKAEPLKVSYLFGEPMLMQVTLQNIGKYDLAIGAEGAVRPDVWFDANLRGIQQGDFKGIGIERFGQQSVLKQNESVTMLARVDRGQLRALLMSNPVAAVSVYFSIFTNPMQGGQNIMPGPAGYREQAKSVVERRPSPIAAPEQLQAAEKDLASTDAGVRMCTAELFATYANLLKNQANATEAQKQGAAKLVESLDATLLDLSVPVRTWSAYLMVSLVAPEQRAERITRMLSDAQWEMRVAGLAAATILAADQLTTTVAPLQKDAEPVVSKLASAIIARAKVAATQPASGPASQPASGPTTPAAPSAGALTSPVPTTTPAPAANP